MKNVKNIQIEKSSASGRWLAFSCFLANFSLALLINVLLLKKCVYSKKYGKVKISGTDLIFGYIFDDAMFHFWISKGLEVSRDSVLVEYHINFLLRKVTKLTLWGCKYFIHIHVSIFLNLITHFLQKVIIWLRRLLQTPFW